MCYSGQEIKYLDGLSALYIDGVKFTFMHVNDEIQIVDFIEVDESAKRKWARKGSFMQYEISDVIANKETIQSIARRTNTLNLISHWTTYDDCEIYSYNPSMKDNGVILTRQGDKVTIDVSYTFSGIDLSPYDWRTSSKEKVVENGIAKWANKGMPFEDNHIYDFMGKSKAIYVDLSYHYNPIPKAVLFRFNARNPKKKEDDLLTSETNWAENVAAGLEKKYFDKLNWHVGCTRIVDLYPVDEPFTPEDKALFPDPIIYSVAAHEFGHVLGLSDAYAGLHPEAPMTEEVPEYDIMRSPVNSQNYFSGTVTSNDIEMVLMAFIKNETQWFYANMSLSEAIKLHG